MTSTILYKGDLRTEMMHIGSGSMVETDAPLDNQGKGERFSPTDLVATALGACMLTIMGIAARTHGMDIDGTQMDIEKGMVADPQRRIGRIGIRIKMPQNGQYDTKARTILEKAALTCPVYLSLHEKVEKDIEWVWPS